MDGSNKMITQGEKLVKLAYQLSEDDLHDLTLYLKTRAALCKACTSKRGYKPLSLEKWYRLPMADRYMIYRVITQSTNLNLIRFIDGWIYLKPRQKAYLFVEAMYYYYEEMVRNWLRQFSNNMINK